MIQVRDRFRPFLHLAGSFCMIPTSNWAVKAYPTNVQLFCEKALLSIIWHLTGPVRGFTLQQDLEKDCVYIFGKAQEGYFLFEITHREEKIVLLLKRGFSIGYEEEKGQGILKRGESLQFFVGEKPYERRFIERLSLGVHKKLDWELVQRRNDLKELLPVLFFLGQKSFPYLEKSLFVPKSEEDFEGLIQSYFTSLCMPQREKAFGLGLASKSFSLSVPLGGILFQMYRSIRSLFLQEKDQSVSLLPHLFSPFLSGRALGLQTRFALFHLEWRNRKLRRVQIKALLDGPLPLLFPKEIKKFRLRQSQEKRGSEMSCTDSLFLACGKVYYLDKFQR